MSKIRKLMAILFVVLFVVTVTAGAVSALNPQPEPPLERSHFIHGNGVKSTDTGSIVTTSGTIVTKN